MNFELYPWLQDLDSEQAQVALSASRFKLRETGAVTFPSFLDPAALLQCVQDARAQEDAAFTTDDTHTAYLQPMDVDKFPLDSIYNHEMRTLVASTAFDELPAGSPLTGLYHHPTLLRLVSLLVNKKLFWSEDPLGCCSINVFRPGYYHSFHFDESEFSTTLMLQDAEDESSGLFQCTDPLRQTSDELVLSQVAAVIDKYDENTRESRQFTELVVNGTKDPVPLLHTLDFRPGTLAIFSGSKSLHRVTPVKGNRSRLVAVFTFATQPGFCNSPQVQTLFWGRAVQPSKEQKIAIASDNAQECDNKRDEAGFE